MANQAILTNMKITKLIEILMAVALIGAALSLVSCETTSDHFDRMEAMGGSRY